ncbi:Non-specific lipid transfer protein-like 1 [Zea mays]|uniref:Non-specific lipid transfer protein-like 1 n=1 Tax=Zea mays TaxID=4577 RepID=A0A1D6K4N0_MAIZE|nr:Non-specific lipid transfer protein-like 1 [Zea mays]
MALASRAAAAAVACVLLALAASAAGAGSNSPAPAPAVDCISQAASLIDCIDYVQKGSSARRPSAACCGEVKTAVASPVIVGCLCSLAGSNSSNLGFPIDMKRVLALPAPSAAGGSSSGGAAASSPRAAAASSPPMTATALLAAVAAPLLAYYCCYLF